MYYNNTRNYVFMGTNVVNPSAGIGRQDELKLR